MGRLAERIRAGEFVVTAEINPPRSADAALVRRRAAALKGFVDAANVTDSNRAQAAMSSLTAALLVREEGVEPIVQMTGRDRNRIALQADLLGLSALGLPNVVVMSGDDPKAGDHPDAVNVRDLDGLGILRAAVGMRDQKQFLSGTAIRLPPEYFVGATASPSAPGDLAKTTEKANAGADFLQTQPVFDEAPFAAWLREVRAKAPAKLALIAGVFVLRSAEQTERLAKIPGIAIPAGVIDRMKGAADAEQEGVVIAAEAIAWLRRSGVQGVHLYAIEWPEGVVRVVREAGLAARS